MKCVNCRKKLLANTKKFFSVKRGGIICSSCAPNFQDKIPANDNQIKILRVFLGNPLRKIAKVKIGKRDLEELAAIRGSFQKYIF